MRVVLDTNVIVSFALGNNTARKIIDFLIEKRHALIADISLKHEYRVVLKRGKLKIPPQNMDEAEQLIEGIETYSGENIIPLKFNPDRQDSKIIMLANASDADYIVTNDKQLLRNAAHLCKSKITSTDTFAEIIERAL